MLLVSSSKERIHTVKVAEYAKIHPNTVTKIKKLRLVEFNH